MKTTEEMRISDWSSDVCSSDLVVAPGGGKIVAFLRDADLRREIAGEHELAELVEQVGAAGKLVFHRQRQQRVLLRGRRLVVRDLVIAPALRLDRVEPGADGLASSEGRRVGKECVVTCSSRWSRDHKKKN